MALAHLVLLGCNSTGVGNPGIGQLDQRLIDDGTIALEAGDTSASINSLATIALGNPAEFFDAEAVATLVEQRTPLYFEPAGCLQTSREGATVTFTFDACHTGAFGLLELSGEMQATYALLSQSSVGVSIATAPQLQLGSTEIALQSESFLSVTDSSSMLVGNGHYQATHPLRNDIDHTLTYVATVDDGTQCLRLDGSATTLFGNGSVGVETSLTDYLRCGPRGTCPTSGELALTRLPDRDRSLTLQFNDDRTAWVPELEVEVTLVCRE